MKLADINVDDLVRELRRERSAWIDLTQEEKRKLTEPELATVSILHALERVLSRFQE